MTLTTLLSLTLLACGSDDTATTTDSAQSPADDTPDSGDSGRNTDTQDTQDTQDTWDLGAFEGTVRAQIESFQVTLPDPASAAFTTYGTWEQRSLNPRLYLDPIADDQLRIGWTGESGTGHVAVVDSTTVVSTLDFDGLSVQGLANDGDGGFGVLLLPSDGKMILRRYTADGGLLWESAMTSGNEWAMSPSGSSIIGDSRLEWGGSRFASYFVIQDMGSGHHMDSYMLTWIEDGADYGDVWGTGCSHGMSQLVRTHPEHGRFVPVCSSDAYPDHGIYAWRDSGRRLYRAHANGAGLVSAELGGMTGTQEGLILSFNANQQDCCDAKGVGVINLDLDGYPTSGVTWLTDTDGEHERDSAIARIGTANDDGYTADRYLVGWRQTDDDSFLLGVIDQAGAWQVPAEIVSVEMGSAPGVAWGRRDDAFSTDAQGRVVWGVLFQKSDTFQWFRYSDFADEPAPTTQ